ncbi:MAG: DUF3105 domain-containing protein, partial [Chloroflexota bacterium]
MPSIDPCDPGRTVLRGEAIPEPAPDKPDGAVAHHLRAARNRGDRHNDRHNDRHHCPGPPHAIATRFYGADDRTEPQGWIHNLEHGQMSVLYRCPEGCDEAAQAALRTLQQQLPASPLCAFPASASVSVARFDDLPTPCAAVVWGRVLFLD